jgi:hypothetical protein
MFNYFRKRKVEKVFNELLRILQLPYDEFNLRIPLSQAQYEAIIRNDFLDKHLLYKKEGSDYFITSLGLLTTVCKLLIDKNMYFTLDEATNKVIGLDIKK